MKPQNFEEKVIWYYITGTYVLYLLGAQHILAPAIACLLTLYIFKKLWKQTKDTPEEDRVRVPVGVWVWIVCMLVIELSLVMSHADFNYGVTRVLKSSINGFIRSWFLLALFPLIGGALKIRPQLMFRAACILCFQSLFFIAICYVASKVGLPSGLYTSPLRKLGGVGDAYYQVMLYLPDGSEGEEGMRLYLFAPWAPALGFVGNIYFFLSCQERNIKWRFLGMLGAAAMVWFSVSRLGLLCLVTVPFITLFLSNLTRPSLQIFSGTACFIFGLFSTQLITRLRNFKEGIDGQRARSTEIREMLGRMAIERWREAPIWGHGLKEPRGPAIATFKPIGSHHTWFGVLFTHGLVGFIALAIAMGWSFVELLLKAQKSKVAGVGLSLVLVMFLYSFGENLEVLAYLYWPGLVMLGIAFKEKLPYFDDAILEDKKTPALEA